MKDPFANHFKQRLATSDRGFGPPGNDPELTRSRKVRTPEHWRRHEHLSGARMRLFECATAIKLANNAVLGCAMVAMAEGFALVRKYGVMPQVFQDVMVEGLFAATAYKVYGQKMVDESYDQVGSPITVGLKDALLIAAAADIARVPMPSHDIYRQRLLGAVAHGDADRDQAVLAREQARASGIEKD